LSKTITRALRVCFIPAVWLAFIPATLAAGRDPGFVLVEDIGPYPMRHVLGVILILAVESAFLFVMLSPTSYALTDWRRPLKAFGLVFVAIWFEPMAWDLPGYVYVNTGFLFTWLFILGALAVAGIVSTWIKSRRVTNSEADAA
jgi:hypothetical protein